MLPRRPGRGILVALCSLLGLLPGGAAYGQALEVGSGRTFETLGSALSEATDGDTVRVHAGVYRERVHVRAAITLLGVDRPVLDGGGEGTVLTVEAPAEVRGMWIRASGSDQAREDAGILVLEADGVRVVDNRLDEVLFGIVVKQSRNVHLEGNQVIGMDRPIPRRGDGIRLWYCEGGVVEGNELQRTRDLVIWFSNGLDIRNNRITHGRYGLHYMYSNDNALVGNTFVSNDVGAFVMYSKDIRLEENRFERATGASALGIGLKDSDGIVAERNVFVGNAVGIFLDNSPSTVDGRNRFTRNVLAANGAGVEMLPSVHSNHFEGNAWIGNDVPVVVTGGGDALDNQWNANHWSGYVGFDEDADGTGDTPYRHDRLADDLFARYPDLRFLEGSPAVASLGVLARLFPLLAPRPVVIDSSPVVASPAIASVLLAAEDMRQDLAGDPRSSADGGLPLAALLWTASFGSAFSVVLLARRRRS